ncbi:MAG: glycine cleavage system protein GcvH, partial [Ginsengibacter sp.]
ATVGITEFAQQELGDIVYVEIDSNNNEIPSGEVFGTVEAVKTVSDLFMPLTGTITEINPVLDKEPEKVNTDPYGDGWMIKLKISDNDQVKELLEAGAYEKLVS